MMGSISSSSSRQSSTFNPADFKRELTVAQLRALAAVVAANPKLDAREALGAVLLRMSGDREQLDARDRRVLRAVDALVAEDLKNHPSQSLRDYAELTRFNQRRRRAGPAKERG